MVIFKIQGGLGNQLFQYAYGRSITTKYDQKLYLDISNYSVDHIRTFELCNISGLDINIQNGNSGFPRIMDNYRYEDRLLNDNKNYFFDGFWQTEKYINEKIIRDDFKLSDETNDKIKKKLPTGNNVSMHVRRTDYVNKQQYHPLQTIEYYDKALSLIEHDNIIVFSDDISWCKENLKYDNMVFIEGNTNIEDLYTMTLCNNNIIANSSFSWWGAWLNENPKKKVVAPSKWFGPAFRKNESDIIPDSWIKL